MSPTTRAAVDHAVAFVRTNHPTCPVAARAFVARYLAIAAERFAAARTDLERRIAMALTLTADAAHTALAELEGVTP